MSHRKYLRGIQYSKLVRAYEFADPYTYVHNPFVGFEEAEAKQESKNEKMKIV